MPATPSYAAFRVDPSINFDNFNLGSIGTPSSPTISNFSRPISFRPTLSPNVSHFSFAMSDSSRRSSYVSSKGPVTPQQDPPARESIAGPKVAILEDESHPDILSPSFMLDSHKAPKLDLSFAVESVMRTYQPQSVPQSPLKQSEATDRQRPATAISLAPPPAIRPMSSHKVCPIHGPRQSTIPPSARASRICPVHGPKSPLSTPLQTDTSAPSRKSMGERPKEVPRTDTAQTLPALPFLKQDPFQSSDESGNARPKSAGAGVGGNQQGEGDFTFDRAQPVKKQGAPSIMSTRSTRSIRKGFSRVRRMLNRAKVV